jgi:hypothetical protein
MPLQIDDLDKPIRGAKNIGDFLDLTPRQTFYALEKGFIDASKWGRIWISTPRRLLAQLNGRRPAESAAA